MHHATMQDGGDWNDLRSFLAIARQGSLQGAARTLGVNHSTVFRRLNALEARLGARLFDRSARGYALTAGGEHMLASAERVEDEILGLEHRLLGGDVRLSGTLRVTTTDTLVHGVLGPHLRAFQTAYPAIELELITGNAFFDLYKREADVALRPSRHPATPWSVAGSPRSRSRSTVGATTWRRAAGLRAWPRSTDTP
jgi:DNA-binding transcriptional LysR family regulator